MNDQVYLLERPAFFSPDYPRTSSRDTVDSSGMIKTPFAYPYGNADSQGHIHNSKGMKRTRWSTLQWRDIHSPSLEVFPRGWSTEVISSVISITAFLSIVVILSRYDQQPSPIFPPGNSLAALLAFLTAISQTCFLQPAIQGVSQMQWNWVFGRSRSLTGFDKFNATNQGLWGIIVLLFSVKRRLGVLLAVFFLVTSATISMVTLAVLSHDLRYAPGAGNAAVLQAVNDKSDNSHNVNDALAMMMNAMYTRPDATYEYDAPECTTGNCKYPSFGSLAVCSKSHDITDRLYTMVTPQKWCYQQVEDKWGSRTRGPDICSNYSYAALSPTIYLDYFGSGILTNTSNVWLNSNATWEGVFSFDRDVFAENALNAVHTIYLDSSDSSWSSYLGGLPDTSLYLQHAHAVETLFYLCAQEFAVSTTNGTTSTNVTSTLDYVTDIETFESSPDGYHYTAEYNRIFTLNGHDYSYVMVDEILGQMMMSSLEGKYNNNTYAGMSYMTPFSFATGNVLYHNPKINGNVAAKRNTQMQQALEAMMSNMAKGMTNWLRSTGSPVQGQAEILTEFVVVRWHFLFPLGLQITLSVCFIVWAMIVSKAQKTRILKDSPLTTSFPMTVSDKAFLEEELARENEENNQKGEDVEKLPIEKFGHE